MEAFKQTMTPSMMSSHMDNEMQSEKGKKKTMGSVCCGIVMNAIMAGIWGWFLFPSSNLDIYRRYEDDLEFLSDLSEDEYFTWTDREKG